jgi:hypothetical protein
MGEEKTRRSGIEAMAIVHRALPIESYGCLAEQPPAGKSTVGSAHISNAEALSQDWDDPRRRDRQHRIRQIGN